MKLGTIVLSCDAPFNDLMAVLSHLYYDGLKELICFAFCTLAPTENIQLDKEYGLSLELNDSIKISMNDH